MKDIMKKQIQPAEFRIDDTPYEPSARQQVGKYDAIFAQLKQGQRLVVPSDAANRVAGSLKKWLSQRGHQAPTVRARTNCQDGNGGVWWLEDAPQRERPKVVQTAWANGLIPRLGDQQKRRAKG